MTFPSGAVQHGDDLYCRTCGRMCDVEDDRLSCDNGCFDEAFTPAEGMEY